MATGMTGRMTRRMTTMTRGMRTMMRMRGSNITRIPVHSKRIRMTRLNSRQHPQNRNRTQKSTQRSNPVLRNTALLLNQKSLNSLLDLRNSTLQPRHMVKYIHLLFKKLFVGVRRKQDCPLWLLLKVCYTDFSATSCSGLRESTSNPSIKSEMGI